MGVDCGWGMNCIPYAAGAVVLPTMPPPAVWLPALLPPLALLLLSMYLIKFASDICMISFMDCVMSPTACCSVKRFMRHSTKHWLLLLGMLIGHTCNSPLKLTNAAGKGLLFIGCVMSCQPSDMLALSCWTNCSNSILSATPNTLTAPT